MAMKTIFVKGWTVDCTLIIIYFQKLYLRNFKNLVNLYDVYSLFIMKNVTM